MNIITSSVVMKSEPIETSPLETECLFGETVEILDKHFDWVYCKLETDNYCGWIKKKGLGKSKNPTHRVIVSRSFIYINKNSKSNSLLYLPLGAKILVENIRFDWAEISFNYNNKMQYIDETIFGTQSRFRKHFANPLLAAREPDATDSEIEIGTRRQVELAELTSKFVLRRTNELNKVHLPNKLTMVVVCPLSPLQQQLYEHLTRAENLDRENNKYSIFEGIDKTAQFLETN